MDDRQRDRAPAAGAVAGAGAGAGVPQAADAAAGAGADAPPAPPAPGGAGADTGAPQAAAAPAAGTVLPAAAPPAPGGGTVRPFPSAQEDTLHTRLDPATPQTGSPAYRLSYADVDFLMRDDLRGTRLQLEFLKPDLLQRDRGIKATVVVFGSARIPPPDEAEARVEAARAAAAADPDDPDLSRRERIARALAAKCRYYDEARRLSRFISEADRQPSPDEACILQHPPTSVVVVTGGGPGIMEAANRGAHDVNADTIGLNIVLPYEQAPNAYITPHLCFNFHYFAIRKMHFLLRAVALVVFPGGFGTLDELFEVLTLIQTHKINPIPVLLFGKEYWDRIIDFEAMVDEGVIAPRDLDIFSYVETAEEAFAILEPVLTRART